MRLECVLQCGADVTDMDAIVMVSRLLHTNNSMVGEPIAVYFDEAMSAKRVFATARAEPNQIMLPACVPRSNKVYENSTHPHRFNVSVERRLPQEVVALGAP